MKTKVNIAYPTEKKFLTAREMVQGVLYYCWEPNIEDYVRNILYIRSYDAIIVLGASGDYIHFEHISKYKDQRVWFRAPVGIKVTIEIEQN